MKTIAYVSPWVPPEWIAAHGARPRWLRLARDESRPSARLSRGVCPFAGEVVETLQGEGDALAVVLTTTCDQMRYAAALLTEDGPAPVFLMNVPSTWQSSAARQLYRDELQRLGRFLVGLGGNSPSAEELGTAIRDYEVRRNEVVAHRAQMSARRFAEAMATVRSGDSPALCAQGSAEEAVNPKAGPALAIVGGPMVEKDFWLLDRIEQYGARIVLDGTEAGERSLPARTEEGALAEDPLSALAAAYFDGIVDVFRRPNDPFYEWLSRQVAARGVQGIVVRRYVWCDLWHAELQRIKETSGVPVLEVDVDGDADATLARTTGRLEAFLEMLR